MNTVKAQRVTRRKFLAGSAGAAAGMTSWLALGKAPAFAQKRELTFLSWNHFVPASDEELRRQAEEFGKLANCTVRVDTIAHLQIPAKVAAEAQSQSGHDMWRTNDDDPFLYENLLVDVSEVVDKLGKQGGGWYSFSAEACQAASGWKSVPWYWATFPGNYNEVHFKKAGLQPPKTWDELLRHGKILKKQGNPVGIAVSHCSDANTTFWSVAWCHGAKALEADGKSSAINSDKTAQVIEWYKELFKDAMEPEVLSWDDASNNRFLLSGKGSWIHNPVSPYAAAVSKKMPIADEINHHNTPAGPAGRHVAGPILSIGIWKFSKNIDLAKEFIQFHIRKDNYAAWVTASQGFNNPALRNYADHPVWSSNPKFAMLPKEAEYTHPRGWPAKPNAAIRLIDVNYVMPDMVAKAINGMPTKRAMAWAEEQVALAVKGQLQKAGKS